MDNQKWRYRQVLLAGAVTAWTFFFAFLGGYVVGRLVKDSTHVLLMLVIVATIAALLTAESIITARAESLEKNKRR